MKNKHIAIIIATPFAFTNLAESAVLAFFNDGSVDGAAAYQNIASNYANITVSDLTRVGLGGSIKSDYTRNEYGSAGPTPAGPAANSALGSHWIASIAHETRSTVGPGGDYYLFTITAAPGTTFTPTQLIFDMITAANGLGLSITADANVYYSTTGTSANTLIGSETSSASRGSGDPSGSFSTSVSTANIDLTSLGDIDTLQIRIAMSDNYTANSAAIFLQGIQLHITPEPSTLGALAFGLILLGFRKRR